MVTPKSFFPLFLFLIIVSFAQGQSTFGEQNIIVQSDASSPRTVISCDIDGDGKSDIISTSSGNYDIAWWKNEGQGVFETYNIISTNTKGSKQIFACDFDNDGDYDVLSASSKDDKIAWFENIDGQGTFSNESIITDSFDKANDIFSCDLDNDGDHDVIASTNSHNEIAWYENTGQNEFSLQQTITITHPGSLFSCDLDNDGYFDILSVSGDTKIVWYKNDGQGAFGLEQTIVNNLNNTNCIYACDLDNDGDNDVLSASYSDDEIAWYENLDGNGNFSSEKLISISADGAYCVYAADIDNDGDNDVISSSLNDTKIAWYENGSPGNFGYAQIISSSSVGVVSIVSSDLDEDGDIDIISASPSEDKIAWYENSNGQGTFTLEHLITKVFCDFATCTFSCDLDGDGDNDVLSASLADSRIAWYKNIDGKGNFSPQIIISTNANGASYVYSCDIDNDGDNDVLSASVNDNKIAWYENTDGNGVFGTEQIISVDAISASCVYACDLDGDGDNDVISASQTDNKIAWYENMDGQGSFGSEQVIPYYAGWAISVYSTDIDGDNDNDIICTSIFDKEIVWAENTDGLGTFGSIHIVDNNSNSTPYVYSCDLDNDGDNDILSGGGDNIAWYENTDGLGTFGPEQIINSENYDVHSIFANDLDNDGDMDIISAHFNMSSICWIENMGAGLFSPQHVISTKAKLAWFVYSCDIDGDGYNDVLSASANDDKIAWYKNLTSSNIPVVPSKKINIYPNPAQSIIIMDELESKSDLYIYDITGKRVKELNDFIGSKINVKDIEPGLYILLLKNENGKSIHKFIKE